jgi:hypothetical protein
MAVCLVTLQRMQELNTGSTAAILRDQTEKEPAVPDEKKAIFIAAHSPSSSTLRSSSTLSPTVELWPRSSAPLSPEPPVSVGDGLVEELSRLRLDGELPLDLLPELQERTYFGSRDAGDASTSFIDARQNSGRPVTLVRPPRP